MQLKTKVTLSYLVILFSVIFLTVFPIIKITTNGSQNSAEFLRTKVSASMSEMKQIKVDIIQIQQWLTDVSATAYLDGFDIAEEYFDDANRLLDINIQRKVEAEKTEIAEELQDLKAQMQAYYDVGKAMAHQYIENGRIAGNVWMDKFDPEAEKLTEMVDKQVAGYSEVYDLTLQELANSQHIIVKMLIGISIPTILIIIIMAIIIYISLKKGMKLITEYSYKLANNDITEPAMVRRKDEFGISAEQFNSSFKLLNYLVSSIKKSTDTTINVKDSLATSAEETSATILNIKNSTASLSKESEKLNKTVANNVTVVEEITANIGSINNQISEQAAMVEESTASITEMISSLDSVNTVTLKKKDSINSLVAVVGTGSSTLNKLAEGFKTDVVSKIEGISEMATTIQQISSQTNLLSMNAAIEAAHAGDAGKGFAVVADEIRKLADTSAKSSASIARIIKEISEGVSETDSKTTRTSEAFDVINKEINSVKQAFDEIASSTQELNVGGKQILDAMTTLQDVTINVKGASEEMTIGSEQIIRGQLELKDISDNVNRGIGEISSGSEEIVIAADEILKYSLELDSIVNNLKEETDKFSV